MADDVEAPTLTARALRVMAGARDQAARRKHGYVGTEHILLALLDEPEGIAAKVVEHLGATRAVRAALEEIMGSPGYREARA